MNPLRRLFLGTLAAFLGRAPSLAREARSDAPAPDDAEAPGGSTVKPRHVLCFLGGDRNLAALSAAARRAIADVAPGFSVDETYSEAEPDDRMSRAFEVCWDRVPPKAWTDADEAAVAGHQSVLYVLGPSMSQAEAVDVSMAALRLIGRLIEAGAVAVKGESAGVAHGLDRWRELVRRGAAALESGDRLAQQRVARLALARRPISSGYSFKSVGFHLVGLPEVVAPASDGGEMEVVATIDAVADEIAKQGLDRTLKERRGTLSFRSAYEEDSFKFNPYGSVMLAE